VIFGLAREYVGQNKTDESDILAIPQKIPSEEVVHFDIQRSKEPEDQAQQHDKVVALHYSVVFSPKYIHARFEHNKNSH
jgi:hypothetical protein